jgi:hypothetical protein
MLHCSACSGLLEVREMVCPACEMRLAGDFAFPRLLRLSSKNLVLAEALVLAGGNLKALARTLEISYPTLRKRVDDLNQRARVAARGGRAPERRDPALGRAGQDSRGQGHATRRRWRASPKRSNCSAAASAT